MVKSFLWLVVGMLFSVSGNLYGQGCQNNIKYPAGTITAPSNFDTILISNQSFPGDYALANEFIVGETYVFTSDAVNDVITLRSVDQSTVLAFGPQPLVYSITTDTAIHIHFNLPGCNTEVIGRATKIIHHMVIDEMNVGINTSEPQATLDVNGRVKVGDDMNSPVEGMVRYNNEIKDFEGFDGQKWRSFTKTSGVWGKAQPSTATPNDCFTVDDGNDFDLLGTSLDIDEDYAAVSAYGQDINGNNNQGAVFILKKLGNSFVFNQKIENPTGDNFDQFGQGGIDVAGNLIIVGSPGDNYQGSVGTADIFNLQNESWSWVTTLSNNSGINDFHFGGAVAINENYAAVRNEDATQGIDEVIVFKKVGLAWQLLETIISPSNSGTFGAALEFYNNDLYVGDPDYFSQGVLGGRVSIFDIDENDNVIIMDSIENVGAIPNFNDGFGREIDIDNGKMIISGVGYRVDDIFRSGQAYIYTKENGVWVLEQVLQEDTPTEGSDFGNRVSIYGDQALVTTSIFNGAPKTYVYKFENAWELESILMSGEPSGSDFFGLGAEISENLIMIGASKTDVGDNQDQGKVYIFCK